MRRVVMFVLLIFLVTGAMAAPKDGPVYREPNKYPILDEIVARRDAMAAERDSLIQLVRDQQDSDADTREEAERSLRVDWSKIERPAGPDEFKIHLPHTPPIAQFYTGTCWAFSATSLMESEAIRLTGHEVKLS